MLKRMISMGSMTALLLMSLQFWAYADTNSGFDAVLFYDGVAEETTDYTDATGDVPLGGDTAWDGGDDEVWGGGAFNNGDNLILGAYETFGSVSFEVSTSNSGGNFVFQYYDQDDQAWNDLDVTTSGFSGTETYSWDVPSGWGINMLSFDKDHEGNDVHTNDGRTDRLYFVIVRTESTASQMAYASQVSMDELDGATSGGDDEEEEEENEEEENEEELEREASFEDVDADHENAAAIEYLVEAGVVNGYGDGTFGPSNEVNRAEIVKMLMLSRGIDPTEGDTDEDCFPDLEEGAWYAPYVCAAVEEGWVNGKGDGYFYPADTVNKVEAVKLIVHAMGWEDELSDSVDELAFDDADASAWYAPYLELALEMDLLESESGDYEPASGMARDWVAEYIFRGVVLEATGEAAYSTSVRADFFVDMGFDW